MTFKSAEIIHYKCKINATIVYGARAMGNISLLNLGGKFPKEIITVVIFKSDRPKFEKEPVELYQNKSYCVQFTLLFW